MTAIIWLLIIAKIIKLITSGMDRDEAVEKVAAKTGISKAEIYKHGGF